MKTFDFIIIGSGQAGTPLAFSLSKKGKVAPAPARIPSRGSTI